MVHHTTLVAICIAIEVVLKVWFGARMAWNGIWYKVWQ